jgi:hypothetical protein
MAWMEIEVAKRDEAMPERVEKGHAAVSAL